MPPGLQLEVEIVGSYTIEVQSDDNPYADISIKGGKALRKIKMLINRIGEDVSQEDIDNYYEEE